MDAGKANMLAEGRIFSVLFEEGKIRVRVVMVVSRGSMLHHASTKMGGHIEQEQTQWGDCRIKRRPTMIAQGTAH